jgi:hypothetical protein
MTIFIKQKKNKMKLKSVFSIFIFLILLVTQSCTNSNKKHIGKWKDKENAGFEFREDGTFSAIVNNVVHDVIALDNGNMAKCVYSIDYNRNPILLKLELESDTKEKKRVTMNNCILNFKNDNELEIMVNKDGGTYEKMDSTNKDYIKLTKVE